MTGQEATTRDRILDAAARLFHEQGYHATGVATILRQADVNAGSMYHFFPSKEALLVGVLERYKALCHPVVMAPVEAASADPIERVFALMQQYRDWLTPISFAMGCPIGNLALEIADGYADIRALIRDNFDNWARFVEGWLKDAGERLPEDLDRGRLAHFVLTVMEGGVMQARAAGSPAPFDESIAQLRVHFDLLLARAASERGSEQRPKSKGKPRPPGGGARRAARAGTARRSRGKGG